MLTVALASACTGVDIDPDCTPLYEPTFENVYTNTLAVSCSVGTATCHNDAGADTAGGLNMQDADTAFSHLLDGRVEAGDASCSLVVERLESDGDDAMPPGRQLDEEERCAVVQWIEGGAER